MEEDLLRVFPDKRDAILNSVGNNLVNLNLNTDLADKLSDSSYLAAIDLKLKTIGSLISEKVVGDLIAKEVAGLVNTLRIEVTLLQKVTTERTGLVQKNQELERELVTLNTENKHLKEQKVLDDSQAIEVKKGLQKQIELLTEGASEESKKKIREQEEEDRQVQLKLAEEQRQLNLEAAEEKEKKKKDRVALLQQQQETAKKKAEEKKRKLELEKKHQSQDSSLLKKHGVDIFLDIALQWNLSPGQKIASDAFVLKDLDKFDSLRDFEDSEPVIAIPPYNVADSHFLSQLITDAESLGQKGAKLVKAYKAYDIIISWWVFKLSLQSKSRTLGSFNTDPFNGNRLMHNILLSLIWIHFSLHKSNELPRDFNLTWAPLSLKKNYGTPEQVLVFYNFTFSVFKQSVGFIKYLNASKWKEIIAE